MITAQFKISGKERRELKKELAELKSLARNFWHYHQLDKDMCDIYGGSKDYPMSDEQAQERIDQTHIKIKEIEDQLTVLYCN
jgi:hypothetical protein